MAAVIVAADSENLSNFSHQVAGHKTSSNMLAYMNKFVLKPLVKSDLFQREKSFYDKITRSKCNSSEPNHLSFIPDYFGHIEVHSDAPDKIVEYLVLEDLTLSYNLPNVMDIKIGMKTYEPSASIEKVEKETNKYPPQAIVGFRISGLKYYDTFNEKYVIFDKKFGRSLQTTEEILYGLSLCFPKTPSGAPLYNKVLRSVIGQLNKQVLSWMENQREHCFSSSSILVVYSSDSMDSQVEHSEEAQASVSMIDFAHVTAQSDDLDDQKRRATGDDNYITGLVSLIKHLEAISSSDVRYS